MGKIAASVLLKLLNGNERCHTTDPLSSQCMSRNLFSNVNSIQSMIPKDLIDYVLQLQTEKRLTFSSLSNYMILFDITRLMIALISGTFQVCMSYITM